MNYTNETIRRQDRLLSESDAINLLRVGEYGVLSMVSTNATGYGIPISYAWDGENAIYFHCAPLGKKLDNLAANNKASLCVVGHTKVLSDKFTTKYESIIVKGSVCLTLPDDEKMKALEMILDKYSTNDKLGGIKYAEKSCHRTAIIRLDIESLSGKCK